MNHNVLFYFSKSEDVVNTNPFPQVQAICAYGDAKLKSKRASMYITTFPLPHSAQEQGKLTINAIAMSCNSWKNIVWEYGMLIDVRQWHRVVVVYTLLNKNENFKHSSVIDR